VNHDVTHILGPMRQGDPKAAKELLPLRYQELRQLAAHGVTRPAYVTTAACGKRP